MRRVAPETLDAWAALLAAHRRLTQVLDDELRPLGVTLDEYDVLLQVRRAGQPLRMTQLAERALISRPTASRVVDRMVDKGWVRRWRDSGDRRVVLLALTDEGRRVHTAAARVHLDGIARLVEAPLAGHDVGALAAALRVLAGDGAVTSEQPSTGLSETGDMPPQGRCVSGR